MKQFIDTKRMFLVDAIGALITACFLFFVLIPFETVFGMPVHALRVLSGIAIGFCMYSSLCYFFAGKRSGIFLKGIAVVNGLYCFVTIGLLVGYHQTITFWGFAYFILELFVISLLVYFEWKATVRR